MANINMYREENFIEKYIYVFRRYFDDFKKIDSRLENNYIKNIILEKSFDFKSLDFKCIYYMFYQREYPFNGEELKYYENMCHKKTCEELGI